MNTSSPFYRVLTQSLERCNLRFDDLCPANDPVAQRVLADYGAMFVSSQKIMPPPVCVFTNEDEVTRFQQQAGHTAATIGDAEIELQPAAMQALLSARGRARTEALDITPRDGAEAARRSYADTVRLWNTRFLPGLDHWTALSRLSRAQADWLRQLPIQRQVAEVLELEKSGIFFSKDLSKSILYSIAAPGTSQHIAMLAFDVNEFQDARVREILAHHGWFQTVLSDRPHFTYLGLEEGVLPQRGLKRAEVSGQTFWIPDLG
jgi:hypothetical protein